MMKDEPEADMFASCRAIELALRGVNQDKTSITWVNWHGNELTRA